ncbi:MAG: short chain dehydrogenase, partial [Bacteroidetes bacterium]|nr:short chain dehydrogenase [Bacteroidota bacterium]
AVNALWPATTIATAAVRNLLGGEEMVNKSRTPDIVADAAAKIFSVTNNSITGQHLIDEDVLRSHGVNDFTGYAVDPTQELMKDLFLE